MSNQYSRNRSAGSYRNRKRKVVKYRKPVSINIGTVLFMIVFLYLIIQIILYFKKEQISIYEVTENTIADDNTCKGVVIRSETVVDTSNAGYINYYLRDGDRVAKNSIVYTIDEGGELYENITAGENTEGSEEGNRINSIITAFQKSYSDNKYSTVYDLKYDIDNSLYETTNFNMVKNLKTIMNDAGNSTSFHIVKAPESGILSYSIDTMENLKAEDVTPETFNMEDYVRTQLRTDKLMESKHPVYKIVTSEDWSIVINLTEDQYKRIQKKADPNHIKITFIKDELTTIANVKCYKKGDSYFAELSLDEYMIHYVNDRFLDIELTINSAEGLKIPNSSIVNEEFFKIPLEYFTVDADSGNMGIYKEVYNKEGEFSKVFISAEKYYEDKKYGYIDQNIQLADGKTIVSGDWIHNEETKERFQVREVGKLEGVYNMNKGYPVFRRIEKIYDNSDYCIISKDTQYGLSVYDHIILNADAEEEPIVK